MNNIKSEEFFNMKKVIIFLLIAVLFNFSCFKDDGSSSGNGGSGSTGTLKITVKTSSDIWGYPKLKSGSTSEYEAYSGDTLYTWQYPETGGELVSADPETNLANQSIPYPDSAVGDKVNYVYLYSEIGEKSNSTPVLYNGNSDENNSTITISDIEEGSYYIVAFYDYKTGGVQTNVLNRYDRYAFYTSTDPMDGTENSTLYADKASVIKISEGETTEITLVIKSGWLLGKPKSSDGGTGRMFLESSDPVPTPDGNHP